MTRACALAVLILSLPLLAAPSRAEDEAAQPAPLRQRLHEHDQHALERWEPRLRELLQTLGEHGADADSLAAAAAMRALLDSERLPLADGEPGDGSCRVRSLQANALGAYQYPWFGCELWQEAGHQVFHKATGSQRRFALLQREDAHSLFFLGGMYFSDEKPRGYSSDYTDAPDQDTRNRDSIGLLFKLASNRYLVAFAPNAQGFELYELTTR